MVLNAPCQEPLPGRYENQLRSGNLSPADCRHVEKAARILNMPVAKLLQLSETAPTSAPTRLVQAHQEVSPQETQTPHSTDRFTHYSHRLNGVTAGQAEQTPLTPETLTDFTNQMGDDVAGTFYKTRLLWHFYHIPGSSQRHSTLLLPNPYIPT